MIDSKIEKSQLDSLTVTWTFRRVTSQFLSTTSCNILSRASNILIGDLCLNNYPKSIIDVLYALQYDFVVSYQNSLSDRSFWYLLLPLQKLNVTAVSAAGKFITTCKIVEHRTNFLLIAQNKHINQRYF